MRVVETKVRLTPETRERIKALIGPNRIAAFIREAIEHVQKRREDATE